jgi:3-carboxymuconate cyclase
VFSPDGHYLFAQDLGADKLYSYRYTPDGSRGLFGPTDWRYTQEKAGTGPRHLVFGADGKHAYLTSELAARSAPSTMPTASSRRCRRFR